MNEVMPKLSSVRSQGSVFGLENIWEEGARVERISKLKMVMQLAFQAWRSFIAAPFTSFLTVLTTAVVLSVFGVFVLALENVSDILATHQGNVSLRMYLQEDVQAGELEKLKGKIEAYEGIESTKVISKSDALSEFRSALGEQVALIDGLEQDNPLPASIEVKFRRTDNMNIAMEQFVGKFKDEPQVQYVQYNQGVLGSLAKLVQSFKLFGTIAIVVMFLIAAFVISITIRLALYAHRQEIAIMRLVGATNRFICTPFLIEGATQGLVGSILALIVLSFSYEAFNQSGALGTDLWATMNGLQFLSIVSCATVLFAGPLVGLLGSFLAVRRFSEE